MTKLLVSLLLASLIGGAICLKSKEKDWWKKHPGVYSWGTMAVVFLAFYFAILPGITDSFLDGIATVGTIDTTKQYEELGLPSRDFWRQAIRNWTDAECWGLEDSDEDGWVDMVELKIGSNPRIPTVVTINLEIKRMRKGSKYPTTIINPPPSTP